MLIVHCFHALEILNVVEVALESITQQRSGKTSEFTTITITGLL